MIEGWVKSSSGNSPEAKVILVHREDDTYELAYASMLNGKILGYFTEVDEEDIRRGELITHWLNIPEIENDHG